MTKATIRSFVGCRWSDGRAVSRAEKKRLVAMRNNPRTRLPAILIETDEQWWLRVRGALEGAFLDPRAQRGVRGRTVSAGELKEAGVIRNDDHRFADSDEVIVK